MQQYALYLRKSRADLEAEARGEGETLARHRRALTELANRRGMRIIRTYEEIVSGDTIAARPQMQALLAAVEAGVYDGVIVNDIDRLARGDSVDQAIIRQTFAGTNTVIITPDKTYNLANSTDDDQLDFKLFMARFEYKAIKRRMQTGRMRSAAEGNFIGTRVPFGYQRIKRTDRAGYTLIPDPLTAPAVQQMFHWYAYEQIGAAEIANRLNAMGLRTMFGHLFTMDRVRRMLVNPNYIGQCSWAKKIKATKIVDGKKVIMREQNSAPIIVENAHPALIDQETWETAQMRRHGHKSIPKNTAAPVSNVLAGIVRCAQCGYTMQRKPGVNGRPDLLFCRTPGCKTTGIYIQTVEEALLETIKQWKLEYTPPEEAEETPAPPDTSVLDKRIATIEKQLEALPDLLEQGIYTPQEYIQRRDILRDRKQATEQQREELLNTPTDEELISANLPQIKYAIEAYYYTDNIELKNALLKSIIHHVDYDKTKHCYKNEDPASFLTLTIYPRKDIF